VGLGLSKVVYGWGKRRDEQALCTVYVSKVRVNHRPRFFCSVGMGAGGGAEGGGEAAGGAGEGTPPVDLEHHKQDSFGGAAAAAGGS
jgi:hypothetical protein